MPKIGARYKSGNFNSRYFALQEITSQSIGAGIEFNTTIEARYHVGSNLYLLGSLGGTLLDSNAYDAKIIEQKWQSEAYLGFAFFNDISKPKKQIYETMVIYVLHTAGQPLQISETS